MQRQRKGEGVSDRLCEMCGKVINPWLYDHIDNHLCGECIDKRTSLKNDYENMQLENFNMETHINNLALKKYKEVMSMQEEIITAFVAKYGMFPDELEVVQQQTSNGGWRWFIKKSNREIDYKTPFDQVWVLLPKLTSIQRLNLFNQYDLITGELKPVEDDNEYEI